MNQRTPNLKELVIRQRKLARRRENEHRFKKQKHTRTYSFTGTNPDVVEPPSVMVNRQDDHCVYYRLCLQVQHPPGLKWLSIVAIKGFVAVINGRSCTAGKSKCKIWSYKDCFPLHAYLIMVFWCWKINEKKRYLIQTLARRENNKYKLPFINLSIHILTQSIHFTHTSHRILISLLTTDFCRPCLTLLSFPLRPLSRSAARRPATSCAHRGQLHATHTCHLVGACVS